MGASGLPSHCNRHVIAHCVPNWPRFQAPEEGVFLRTHVRRHGDYPDGILYRAFRAVAPAMSKQKTHADQRDIVPHRRVLLVTVRPNGELEQLPSSSNSSHRSASAPQTNILAVDGVRVPRKLHEFAELLGPEETFSLVERVGGISPYIPNGNSVYENHLNRFKIAFGQPLADRLIRYYGGGKITVPLCDRWLAAVYLARGEAVRNIALRLRRSEWGVRRMLDRRPAEKYTSHDVASAIAT